ncbi:MAG: hypothetical protein HW419_4057 [Deltaproteobacteria bacterium]|nr:hypothetical protein [Deltaproteobacteria bacterium]
MTFANVLDWCRNNRADVRGVYRGKDVSISHKDKELPGVLPSISEIFHWDVDMPDLNHYVSSSDFERIVTGRLTIEGFKSTLRGRE